MARTPSSVSLSERLSPYQKLYLLLIAGFILGPFIPLIIQSFAFRWAWPDLLPGTWWLEQRDKAVLPLAWDYVISPYSQVWEATVNTVFIGCVVTVICLVICLPAARVLARESFPGKPAFEFFLSMPLIVPEAAIGIALLMIFIQVGLAGSYLGIIIVHLIPTIPYMIRMLTAVYQGLGRDFEEQAMILGASRWQTFRRVTLPLLRPSLQTALILRVILAFEVFAVVAALSGTTFPVLMGETYRYQFDLQDGSVAAAIAMVILALSIGFTLLLMRVLRVPKGAQI